MANIASQTKENTLSRAIERMDRRIARDLRALRRARSLTLAQISESVGRSVGWLSQVERGLSMPTLADLSRLADAFGVPASLLFSREQSADAEQETIVRAKARRTLGSTEQGLSEELLSPTLGGDFEMRQRVFAAGSVSKKHGPRNTEEAGYVLSGSLAIEIDGNSHTLDAGDSFRFKGRYFQWRNDSDTDAVVIWVMSPPVY